MIYIKKSFLVVLIIIGFIRCSEVYNPKIDTKADALIVEGLITDGDGPFSIKLSKAVLFTSDSTSKMNYLSGAKLTVNDNENNTFELTDSGLGVYTMPVGFKAKIGNSYKLHIQTPDGNVYESSSQRLLPPQSYDSIHATYNTKEYLNKNNDFVNIGGAEIAEDLFKAVSEKDSIPSCRFNSNITVQYYYTIYNPTIPEWHWVYFGWESFPLNNNENITDEKSLSTNTVIKNHSLGFMPFEMSGYGLGTPASTAVIYYLRINQYTMNNDSYLFYKGANNQLAASGKIFDPVTTQLYGNMKCINNPSKTVLGLFEVSSVSQQSFIVSLVYWGKSIIITKVPYIEISFSPEKGFKVWDSDPMSKPKDSIFNSIPLPVWWYHN